MHALPECGQAVGHNGLACALRMSLRLRGTVSGWVTMKKASGGGWKQVYMNLEGAKVVYYRNNSMSDKTKLGEISLSQARVLPCRFAGAAPTPAGMAVATGSQPTINTSSSSCAAAG